VVAAWAMGGGSGATGDVLEPAEGEVVDASADATGEAEGDAFCDTVGEFDVLADCVEEGVEGGTLWELWRRGEGDGHGGEMVGVAWGAEGEGEGRGSF